MPIIIMPNGEMVDSVTGNPVNTPTPMPENMGQFLANRKFPNTEKTAKQIVFELSNHFESKYEDIKSA